MLTVGMLTVEPEEERKEGRPGTVPTCSSVWASTLSGTDVRVGPQHLKRVDYDQHPLSV